MTDLVAALAHRTVLLIAGVVYLSVTLLTTPAWAAFPGSDGRIAFEASGAIYSVMPDGSGLRKLAVGSAPAWSADGQSLVFVRDTSAGPWIFTMSGDGSEEQPLTKGTAPGFSPDGTTIVYSTERAIRSIGLNGTGGMVLAKTRRLGIENRCCVGSPESSPDGRRIVFRANSRGSAARAVEGDGIWTVKPNGSKLRHLSQPKRQQFDLAPTFSPDGRHIAFDRVRFGMLEMRADGSRLRPLLRDISASGASSYSPSGAKLVSARSVIGTDYGSTCHELFTTDRRGRDLQYVVKYCGFGLAPIVGPAWQPVPE